MFVFPTSNQIPIGNHAQVFDYPAANTTCSIVLPATTGVRWIIHNLQWSYSSDPTGGRMHITSGTTTIWDVDITRGGPGGYNLVLKGSQINEAVTILLEPAGTTITGKLNAQVSVSNS